MEQAKYRDVKPKIKRNKFLSLRSLNIKKKPARKKIIIIPRS